MRSPGRRRAPGETGIAGQRGDQHLPEAEQTGATSQWGGRPAGAFAGHPMSSCPVAWHPAGWAHGLIPDGVGQFRIPNLLQALAGRDCAQSQRLMVALAAMAIPSARRRAVPATEEGGVFERGGVNFARHRPGRCRLTAARPELAGRALRPCGRKVV